MPNFSSEPSPDPIGPPATGVGPALPAAAAFTAAVLPAEVLDRLTDQAEEPEEYWAARSRRSWS